MSSLLRIILCLLVFLGLSLGLSYSQPQLLVFLGLDYWELAALEKKLALESQRGECLNLHLEKFNEVAGQKDEILQALIENRITLDQASRKLKDLTPPEYLEVVINNLNLQEKSPQESCYRVTLFWVEQKLIKNPFQSKVVLSRLEKEIKLLLYAKEKPTN